MTTKSYIEDPGLFVKIKGQLRQCKEKFLIKVPKKFGKHNSDYQYSITPIFIKFTPIFPPLLKQGISFKYEY